MMCVVLISVILLLLLWTSCSRRKCMCVCAKHVISYTLLDFPLQNRLHFEYEHGRPQLRAKNPLASFPLPAPVRASVPLRTRHSTDEKEDYVL